MDVCRTRTCFTIAVPNGSEESTSVKIRAAVIFAFRVDCPLSFPNRNLGSFRLADDPPANHEIPFNGFEKLSMSASAIMCSLRSFQPRVTRRPQQEDHLFGITRLRKTFQLPSGCSCQTVRYRSMMLFPFGKWALASPHS